MADPLQTHFLISGGVKKSLADWGASACVVEHAAQGNDQMTVTIPGSIDSGGFLFPRNEPVDLVDATNTIRFRGWRLRASAAMGEAERVTYEFLGPWQTFLDGITFLDTANYQTDPNLPTAELENGPTSEIVLCRDLLSGTKISILAMVEKALNSCIGQGGAFTYSLLGLPVLAPPEDEQQDRTCGEVVRSLLRYHPETVAIWNYAAAPQLRFGDAAEGGLRRADAPAGPEWIDLAHPPSWAAHLAWSARHGLKITDRADLLCGSYAIIYVSENSLSAPGGVVIKWLTTSVDSAEVANGSRRRLTSTARLRGAVWNGAQWEDPEEQPGAGLAAQMLRPWARPQWELEFGTVGKEVDWTHAPGSLWCVKGFGPELENANAVLQKITRDLGSGSVTYHAGPPPHVALGDFRGLTRPLRRRKKPARAGEMQHGLAAPDPGKDTSNADPTTIIAAIEQEDSTLVARKLTLRDAVVGEIYDGS